MNHPSSPLSHRSSLALGLRVAEEEEDENEEETSLRILLAEDNHELRRLLSFALRRDGHHVVDVHDGSALLDTLARSLVEGGPRTFDLVICEHNLPGMTGLSVLAGLRDYGRAVPFILIASDTEVQKQAWHFGAVVLGRPLTLGAIRSAVRQTEEDLRGATRPVARAVR